MLGRLEFEVGRVFVSGHSSSKTLATTILINKRMGFEVQVGGGSLPVESGPLQIPRCGNSN